MKSTLLCALVAVTIGISWICKAGSVNEDEAISLTTKATLLLDRYSGNTQQLDMAKSALDEAISLNPSYPRAHVEMARYYIKSGHINYRNFKPGYLEAAERSLNTAIEIDPKHANAYVLFGHLYMLMYRHEEARLALEKADKIGTDNPWLQMNWADLLEWEGKHDEKIARYRQLIEQGTSNTRALNKAYGGLIDYHNQKREFQISRQLHQKRIDLDPSNAWLKGRFGFDLLHIMGDVDASITQYMSALRIMNYGAGRFGLATAYLGKWAQLKSTEPESDSSDEYYEKAKQLYPYTGTILAKCGEYLETHYIVKALVQYKNLSIDSKDSNGDTALMLAAYTGKVPEIHSLVNMGANLELLDKNGLTPLMLAAYKGHLLAVKALVADGADIKKTSRTRSAAGIAKYRGHLDVANFLEQAN